MFGHKAARILELEDEIIGEVARAEVWRARYFGQKERFNNVCSDYRRVLDELGAYQKQTKPQPEAAFSLTVIASL